jgi:hypothetical protein
MTDRNGGPAFPVTPTDRSGQIGPTEFGMTIRDAAALAVLPAEYASVMADRSFPPEWRDHIAINCYLMADAMLKVREAGRE